MAITAEQATAIATAIENLNKSVQVNEEVLQIIKSMQTTGAAADVAEHNKDLNAHPEFDFLTANNGVFSKNVVYVTEKAWSGEGTEKKCLRVGSFSRTNNSEEIIFYGRHPAEGTDTYHVIDSQNYYEGSSIRKTITKFRIRARDYDPLEKVLKDSHTLTFASSEALGNYVAVATENSTLVLTGSSLYQNTNSDLGSSTYQWKDLYIQNSPIVSSDRRLKQDFSEVPEAVFKAWGSVKFCQYRFKEAVSKKGAEARLHVGLIAQEIVEAFTEQGLDATAYGIVCHDSWDDQYEDVEVSCIPAVLNEKGEVVKPEEPIMEHRLIKPAGDLWTVRYEEALALEAAYQRWKLQKIEAALVEKGITL